MSAPSNPTHPISASPAHAVPPDLFLECVHCGLCTSSCPTYTELGDENVGPRGRIYLMRMITEATMDAGPGVKRHLDMCLDCRACETACPSGVHYGRIIEPFRLALEEKKHQGIAGWDWFRSLILFQLFPYAARIRLAMTPVRIAQRLGVYDWAERLGLMRLIPGRLGSMATLVNPPVDPGPKLPSFLPAIGRRRARVAFFVGCVADAMFRHTHWATLRVLQQNGCDILIPQGQGCCGAIHFHAGSSTGARRLADANVAAFELDEIDAIIVNHAGCGAMLKEYGLHWHDAHQTERQHFSDKVRDINEFLDQLGLIPPTGPIDAVAAYHDACHLRHAQQVYDPPRRLLEAIPGLQLRPLPESDVCCGSAGTYNLNQPDMADRLIRRKIDNVLATDARIVLASNAGCLLQIGREVRRQRLPLSVLHPMDLLDLSYRGQQPTHT